MSNRRRQYRLNLGDPDMLSISVWAPGKRLVQGVIEDISACGLRVFYKRAVDPLYFLKQTINARLESPYLKKPLTTPCIVTYRGESAGGRLYGFEFLDWLGLLSGLPAELKALFNQRRDHRVVPHPDQPVAITVRAGEQGFQAQFLAQDVSASGLSFVASLEHEQALRDLDTVDLSLRIPTNAEDLRFRGKILHRTVAHDGIRYGVYLLEGATEDFERQVQLLAAYVNGRRREIVGIPSGKPESSLVMACETAEG